MNSSTEWLHVPPAKLDEAAKQQAEQRQAMLTKPPGALGKLEQLAIRLAAMQGTPLPRLDKVSITVFAADHGVAAEGVSAFPQSVTAAMVRNFAHGGAAISVLARRLDAALEVINLGTVDDPGPVDRVLNVHLGVVQLDRCRDGQCAAGLAASEVEEPRESVPFLHEKERQQKRKLPLLAKKCVEGPIGQFSHAAYPTSK